MQFLIYSYIVNINSAAYDVDVKDNDWPEGSFEYLEGENKGKFEKLEPGTNVTFSYTVVPKSIGEIETVPAMVTFKTSQDTEDEDRRIARSNILPKIPVLTQSEYDKRHDSHVDEWAIFFALLILPIGIPFVLYLFANNQISALAAEKKKLKAK